MLRHVRLWQVGILVGALALLEGLAQFGYVDSLTLAPPSDISVTLVDLVSSGQLTGDLYVSTLALLAAFALAVIVGLPIGFALAHWSILQQIADPYLIGLYALPYFALYPLFIVLFGYSMLPIVIIGFFMGLIAVVINTANALNEVPETYRDVGHSLNLSTVRQYVHIIGPAAVPQIFTGLKLGFIYSFIGVIASEFILSEAGLGYQINIYYTRFQTSEMYAVISLVIIVAIVVNTTLSSIEGRLYRRRSPQ